MGNRAGMLRVLEAHERGMADRALSERDPSDPAARQAYFAERGSVCRRLAEVLKAYKDDKRLIAEQAQFLAWALREADFQTAARAALALAELLPVAFVLPDGKPEEGAGE